MKLIKFFKNLQFLFRPQFWIMNNPYFQIWDKELNLLLDTNNFTNIREHRATLGDVNIWISNYPYACFEDYATPANERVRASRLTILRAKKQLEADSLRIGRPTCETIQSIELLTDEIRRIRHILDNLPQNFSHYKKDNQILGDNKIRKHRFK